MREILFRGKRLDNGEWVEGGSLLRAKNEETGEIIIFIGSGKPAVYIFNSEKNIVSVTSLDECAYYRVDSSTVGQYTGLCDKNGRKAFTADITEDEMGRRWIIFDCAGGFGICLTTEWVRNGHELHNGLSETQNAEWFTQNHSIIGNKWDNPELLEDKE